MKNYTPLFIAMACVFSFSCFAQPSDLFSANTKMGNAQLMSDDLSNNDFAVVSYYVEERINMNFGSSITTYEVSTLDLVGTNDLGENNSRVVTPKYAKVRAKIAAVAMDSEKAKASVNTIPIVVIPSKADRIPPKYVYIDILKTYERVIDKGYKSVDMLKKVGNGRFFDGDLTMAAKWYAQLFELTTDLEPIYYYRYAQSLTSISQIEKANEMMVLFENKNF